MNVNKLMKQMQKVQADAMKIQEDLAGTTVEGTAGGGAVKITLNGAHAVQKVEISPEVIESQDKEMTEDLVKAALEDAHSKVAELAQAAMSKAMGGLQVPGLM